MKLRHDWALRVRTSQSRSKGTDGADAFHNGVDFDAGPKPRFPTTVALAAVPARSANLVGEVERGIVVWTGVDNPGFVIGNKSSNGAPIVQRELRILAAWSPASALQLVAALKEETYPLANDQRSG